MADMVMIELSQKDAEAFLNLYPEGTQWPWPTEAVAVAIRDGMENDRLFAESEAAKLPPATLPELGFSHIAECRLCRQPITIARWSHISVGGFPSGNEANADHNPMPDPTTIKEWG